MKRYDLVVIGGGTAGLFASLTAAGLGARVALVEPNRLGGDCLHTGCVPSKSLIASANLVHRMRTADRLALEAVEPRVDFGRVMARIESVIEAAGRRDTFEYLESQGVEPVATRARFVAPGIINAGERSLPYRTALIATGSRPAVPAISGLAETGHLTNETVFELRELPRRLVVIGGGPVGVELGQAFARLGSEVSIVEAEPALLPREEEEVGAFLARRLESEGVALHLGAGIERVEPAPAGAAVFLDGAAPAALACERLLVATGRRPAGQEDLGLDTVGVELTSSGWIRTDRYLRTTASHVYAAGDAVGGPFFTHVAAYHGLVATANALFRARRRVDHAAIPAVTFSDPEVASVGLTEEEARERLGAPPLVFRHDYAESDRALTAAEEEGFAKLIADRRGRLLGATIVAPAAGESIAEVARLVRDRRKVAELSQMVHAYPTFTEGPARAADDWWRRRYFTPRSRRYLRPLLAALRTIDRPR